MHTFKAYDADVGNLCCYVLQSHNIATMVVTCSLEKYYDVLLIALQGESVLCY